MIKTTTTFLTVLISIISYAQNLDEKELEKELSENACKCIDSISASNKEKSAVVNEIHECIDKQAGAMQLGSLLSSIEEKKKDAEVANGKKQINLEFNTNKNSQDYKNNYNKLERTLMNNCSSLKSLINTAETVDHKFSDNEEALDFYANAIEASKKEEWNVAIENYKLALKKDPKFIYAWDNLGICYRRVGNYDKAIESYKKSLALDPTGKMPLQNIAISYVFKKEYQKAIDAYLDLDKAYPNDAEVYYGIGQIYYEYLKEYEKSLDYMAKAYNLYSQQKSPYRSDAEKIILLIHKQMKTRNKLEDFKKILSKNNISFE
ncbi:tetratricopeptide repeat protein [Chryseobacterium sp.]|uniref:tetratricopeptide repeat protein n=1 Tax=Chryseobacterium sp. TaxID=1871047 RepID=UPI00289EF61B|nr:tetratricopeptide repeat protein [Chryseobacterium sp.]